MSTELDVLKQIVENKGKAPIQLIAKQLKIGNDYARYLCRDLLKKGLVKKFKKKDWYSITLKGEKETGKREKPVRKPPKRSISRKKEIEGKIQKKVSKKLKKKIPKSEKKPKKREKKIRRKARRSGVKKVRVKAKEKILQDNKINKIIKVLKNLFRLKKG